MIRYHIDKKIIQFEVGGDIPQIEAEVSVMFSLLYGHLREIHPETAEDFKNAVIRVIGDPNSRIWTAKVPNTMVGSLIVLPEGGVKA